MAGAAPASCWSWDKVLGLGVTDGLTGFAATTANLVVAMYFGKRGFENVARIIKR